jgi:hypothetical protein
MPPYPTLSSILVGLVPALIVGIVTAYVAVRLALSRFRQERWWERKAQAYAELFEALFDVQWYSRRRAEELEEGAHFVGGYMEGLSSRASAAYLLIRKYAAIGPFLFSPATASRLAELEKILDRPAYNEDPLEEVSNTLGAVAAALKDLRTMAHRDLGLPTQVPALSGP